MFYSKMLLMLLNSNRIITFVCCVFSFSKLAMKASTTLKQPLPIQLQLTGSRTAPFAVSLSDYSLLQKKFVTWKCRVSLVHGKTTGITETPKSVFKSKAISELWVGMCLLFGSAEALNFFDSMVA